MVAAVAAVDIVGARIGAQDAQPVLVPISVPGASQNAEQQISGDGNVVVFESTVMRSADDTSTQVLIHDRVTGTTVGVPETVSGGEQSFNPAVSANGCFVTYSTFQPAVATAPVPGVVDQQDPVVQANPVAQQTDGAAAAAQPVDAESVQAAPATSRVHVVDRCAAPAPTSSVIVATETMAEPLPAAALSLDGTFIAYSNGSDIVRMQGTLAGYTLTSVFDTTPVPSPNVATGPRLDMSGDGSTIVFEAGIDPTPGDPTDPITYGVYAWTIGVSPAPPAVRPVASLSTSPSLSDDGRVIAFQSAVGSDSAFAGAVVQVSSAEGALVNISIDPAGSLPEVSGDGIHVVYNTTTGRASAGIAMTSSVASASPFDGVVVTDLSAAVNGAPATAFAVSGPSVSRSGAAVALDAQTPAGTPRVVAVRTVSATATLDATSYDLGVGDVGETVTANVIVTNQGPASLRLADADIVVEAPFVVSANNCSDGVAPRGTCTVEVALTISALEDVFGSVTVTGSDGVGVRAELTALGAAPTSSLETTTSSAPPNTTRNTTVTTTRNTTSNTTRTTTRNTTANTVRVTTTTRAPVEIDVDPRFEPATFDFAPTIIDAGRRTASIEIINAGSSTETLTSAEFADPSSGFGVDDSTACASLTVGARCTLGLTFTPISEGPLTDELVVTFASGTQIRAALTGVGAPAPTLAVIPGVATVGQVVTVQGVGFPAGSTVALTFDDAVERDVVVNDSGTFNVPLVVLPNSQSGPLTVEVEGQVDVFGDVEVEMLVTKTSDRASPGVLGSLGASLGR